MTVIPQLVIDTETGKICAMVRIGSDSAAHELPDYLATATKQELQDYLEKIIPDMVEGLRAKNRAKRRTISKKAKDNA